jgi:hypothetical protein
MDLTINELYEQYEKSIALQSDIIASCRRDLEAAKKARKNKLISEITRYLHILYDERNELMLNAHELKKYIETTQG